MTTTNITQELQRVEARIRHMRQVVNDLAEEIDTRGHCPGLDWAYQTALPELHGLEAKRTKLIAQSHSTSQQADPEESQ